MTRPKNAFEVARDAQMRIDRGINSREDLLAALAAQFECADRIDALGQHITELAALESQLSRSAADYAVSHPEAMTSPLAPMRPDISQGVVRDGDTTYTLTETRGEKLTRLWSRPAPRPPRRLRSDRRGELGLTGAAMSVRPAERSRSDRPRRPGPTGMTKSV